MTKKGVIYITKWGQKLYLVTTNKKHPAFSLKISNMEVIYYSKKLNLKNMFKKLKEDYSINNITIQSGGTMNSAFLREGLIDHVSLVVSPLLIGGKDTSSLVDGESLHTEKDLEKTRALKLVKCEVLKNSYLHLQYDVVNK